MGRKKLTDRKRDKRGVLCRLDAHDYQLLEAEHAKVLATVRALGLKERVSLTSTAETLLSKALRGGS
jgi:hypothetical protein